MPEKTPVLAALSAAVLSGPAWSDTTVPDLLGLWQTTLSEQQAPGGGASAFLRQTVIFTDTRQDIRAEVFADAAGAIPLFTYASSGPYVAVGASDVIDGALNLELVNDRSEVTIFADVPELMAAVGMADCPLVLNTPVDVTTCISGPPFMVTDCTDLDLVLVDAGGQRLRFGDQSVDRCVERPTALDATTFQKVE